MATVVEHLITAEDSFTRLKGPDFALRDCADDQVQIGTYFPGIYRPPAFNLFTEKWHVYLLCWRLHKRCLTSALSGPQRSPTRRRRRHNGPGACGALRQASHGPLQRIVRHHDLPQVEDAIAERPSRPKYDLNVSRGWACPDTNLAGVHLNPLPS